MKKFAGKFYQSCGTSQQKQKTLEVIMMDVVMKNIVAIALKTERI